MPPTPRFFATSAITYDLALDAPEPVAWLQFLGQLWPENSGEISCLQEWFGYFLTPDTRQQKILVLISPRRGGKGTIGRVIRGLIGAANCCGPTLASLASPFGLWPLVGRSVAIIPDARLSSRTDKAVVTERLLAISGEDLLTVDRKFQHPIHVTLPTRLVVLSNEIPRLDDASGTIASRMIILKMTKSWFGAEDEALTTKLLSELPGILLWAIGGWARLRQRRHFQQPASAAALVEQMEDLASPVGSFVKTRCIVGPEHEVPRQALFDDFLAWCKENGKAKPPDAATFGRDLRAIIPTLSDGQRRVEGDRVRYYGGVGLRNLF